jgi:hypothetical protein
MHLISATLDDEAHRIYKSWPPRGKSSEIRYAIKFTEDNGPANRVGLAAQLRQSKKTIRHLQNHILAVANGEEPPESDSMMDLRLFGPKVSE